MNDDLDTTDPTSRVEYQDDAGNWKLWKDKMTATEAEELAAKIETRVTRIIHGQNA